MDPVMLPFLGIPYKPRGIPPKGADCWSLAREYALRMLGQHWPPYLYDAHSIMQSARLVIDHELANLGDRWERVAEPAPGDLLIFRFRGYPVHCGVLLEGGELLHTLHGRNSCIEPLDRWRHNMIAACRWRGE